MRSDNCEFENTLLDKEQDCAAKQKSDVKNHLPRSWGKQGI